jgi:hypothetical protein
MLATSESLSRAAAINRRHRACMEATRDALQSAYDCGRLLIEEKELHPHGTWTRWIKENCELSERTAQRYMAIARDWDKIQEAGEVLSIKAALKLLADEAIAEPRQIEVQTIDVPAQPVEDLAIGDVARVVAPGSLYAGGLVRVAERCGSVLMCVVDDQGLEFPFLPAELERSEDAPPGTPQAVSRVARPTTRQLRTLLERIYEQKTLTPELLAELAAILEAL